MQFHRTRLENGLEVVAECNDEVHSAGVAFFVKTGARDETAPVAGVSHFLEHMVFKGTPTRSAEQVNREFDDIGADNNAYTSKEATVYWAAMLPEYLDKVVELLADILRPSLREEDFALEKKVIIEEIQMYEDQPPFRADELCETMHFGAHPLGNSVLGSVQSIEDLTAAAMREYFEQRYSPRNIVVAGAGRFDFDHFAGLAHKYCGDWTPYENGRAVTSAARQPGFRCVHKPAATQQYVVQMAAAPATNRADRYAADLASTILGDSSGSRLYWALIDSGAAEQAGLYYVEYQGAGIFWTVMSCRPDQAQRNLQSIHDIYRLAEGEGVTEDELKQAKSKSKARTVLSSERPRRRLFNVGGNWVQWGEYLSVKDELAAIDGVTVDDVNRILKDYALSDNTTVVIGPLEEMTRPV